MEEYKKISDENLLKYFTKENLEDMASLFSNGNFQELLNKYFYINKSTQNKEDNNKNNTPKEKEESNTQNNNDNKISKEEPNSNNKENVHKLNYQLFEQLLEDELSQQIILTLVLYCLLKNKEEIKEVKTLLKKYYYPIEDMIFPLNFLIIKYNIKTKDFQQAIDIMNKLIIKYEDYYQNIEEKKLDLKNIYTIETFNQKFIYFDNLFNYLFNMNNIEAKIKKLYFELKTCYYQKNCFTDAYKIILDLYQKYPEDILIQFELAKDSVIYSKPDVYEKILEKMKKNKEEEKDEYKKGVYNNFILYAEGLNKMAFNQFEEANNKFEEILKLRPKENNVILNNNIALLSIYKSNLKEGYESLVNIYQDESNGSKNERINDTIKIIQDRFYIK